MENGKRVRFYSTVVMIAALLGSQFTFQGTRLLTGGLSHIDMTLPVDALIPFLPWTVIVYVGTFVFWIISLYIISRAEREVSDRFFCSQHIGYLATFLIFVIMPTSYTRPEITGTTFWDDVMRLVYSLDPADNLYPSLHCFLSWLCWAGMRGRKQFPFALRLVTFLIAAAICVSTLTTKQHVLIDAVGGIALAELSYLAAKSSKVCNVYTRFIDWVLSLLNRKQ